MVHHLKCHTLLSSDFADDMEAQLRAERGSMQQLRESAHRERVQLWSRWVETNPKQAAEWTRGMEFPWRTEDILDECVQAVSSLHRLAIGYSRSWPCLSAVTVLY